MIVNEISRFLLQSLHTDHDVRKSVTPLASPPSLITQENGICYVSAFSE